VVCELSSHQHLHQDYLQNFTYVLWCEIWCCIYATNVV